MKLNEIQKAIVKTLAFYQVFQIPLLKEELYYRLYQTKCSQKNFRDNLKIIVKKNIVHKKGKYFFLSGSDKIIPARIEKLSFAAKRWEKVNRIIKRLRWIPFIRMIAVVNSLSFNNSQKESDIDLFVVTRKNRLWTCRFFLILFLDIIRENKNHKIQKNRFCLGFWIDENELNLEKFLLKPEDIYFYYWLIHMKPVFGGQDYNKLISRNNWIDKYFPNWKTQKYNIPKKRNKVKNIFEFIFGGWLGNIFEKFVRKLQINRVWKFPENYRRGASVITTRSVLKLHAYDKRKIYETKYKNILKKYLDSKSYNDLDKQG